MCFESNFTRRVVEWLPVCVQDQHVWDGAFIVLFHQLLLLARALDVQVNHHKVHLITVLVIEFDGPARLSL